MTGVAMTMQCQTSTKLKNLWWTIKINNQVVSGSSQITFDRNLFLPEIGRQFHYYPEVSSLLQFYSVIMNVLNSQ